MAKTTPKKPRVKNKQIIQQIAEAPSVAVEATLNVATTTEKFIEKQEPVKKARRYWEILGPGLTTGSADDDPSGIATYSQAGAQYGYRLLWLAPLTFPLMAFVQEMCARIGIVTGRGLAHNIRKLFPGWVIILSTVLLFAANTFNIGADLGALAKAAQLLFPNLNYSLTVVGFAILCLGLQIFVPYGKYAQYLKWLALLILSYVVTAFVIPNMNWTQLLQAAVTPSLNFSKEEIILICGVLGTTISPYLFFWQPSQEVEEEILAGKTSLKELQETSSKDIHDMRLDVWSGMFLSNAVMFFIIAVCANTLFKAGVTNITTAADAAAALRPLAGDYAYLLFALGIFAVGLLGIPVLAGSAAYALSETFGWRTGLYRKLGSAPAFYGVIILSTLIGLLLNFVNLDPIKALIYSAVANGLVAPVALVLIVLIASNKNVMGKWVNSKIATIFGWATVALMTIAGLATIYSIFTS